MPALSAGTPGGWGGPGGPGDELSSGPPERSPSAPCNPFKGCSRPACRLALVERKRDNGRHEGRRALAEDLVQESLLRAVERPPREASALGAEVHVDTRLECLDLRRTDQLAAMSAR
jgi:hypothetical protein